MAEKQQNLANHAKVFPPFHFFVLPVLLVNVIYRLYLLRFGIRFSSIWAVILAVAFLMLALTARLMVLTVQDRVIRLEMRLRLAELLSPDLHPRIPEFTVAQLVGLRFASDSELPALARKVLDDKLADRKVIKQLIKNWQGDYLRA